MPVPEDEPGREALCLDKQVLLNRGEGIIIGMAILLVIIFRGWWLIAVLAGALLTFGYCHVIWTQAIEKYEEKHRQWVDEKWNVLKPHPQGHYVIKNHPYER